MNDLQESNNTSVYSKVTLHMPFPAIISLLVFIILSANTVATIITQAKIFNLPSNQQSNLVLLFFERSTFL